MEDLWRMGDGDCSLGSSDGSGSASWSLEFRSLTCSLEPRHPNNKHGQPVLWTASASGYLPLCSNLHKPCAYACTAARVLEVGFREACCNFANPHPPNTILAQGPGQLLPPLAACQGGRLCDHPLQNGAQVISVAIWHSICIMCVSSLYLFIAEVRKRNLCNWWLRSNPPQVLPGHRHRLSSIVIFVHGLYGLGQSVFEAFFGAPWKEIGSPWESPTSYFILRLGLGWSKSKI